MSSLTTIVNHVCQTIAYMWISIVNKINILFSHTARRVLSFLKIGDPGATMTVFTSMISNKSAVPITISGINKLKLIMGSGFYVMCSLRYLH